MWYHISVLFIQQCFPCTNGQEMYEDFDILLCLQMKTLYPAALTCSHVIRQFVDMNFKTWLH